ncbi:MAG: hypothetical protein HYY07_04785, partial [Elusimicrobia bacterium]|nr:hypothetical protein [Elusimicrobiota bacterium]
MDELKAVWTELESHDWSRPKSLPISNHRVKLYMGAMEIPLVSFQPKESFILSPQKMKEFISILDSLGLELDCVEEGGNYKIIALRTNFIWVGSRGNLSNCMRSVSGNWDGTPLKKWF